MYIINLCIALSMQNCEILTLAIHGLNCFLFFACAKYLFAAITPSTLLLTDDERNVLQELAAGKMQKQIEIFSQNTITKLLKNAQERNLCKTKAELIHRFMQETSFNSNAIES